MDWPVDKVCALTSHVYLHISTHSPWMMVGLRIHFVSKAKQRYLSSYQSFFLVLIAKCFYNGRVLDSFRCLLCKICKIQGSSSCPLFGWHVFLKGTYFWIIEPALHYVMPVSIWPPFIAVRCGLVVASLRMFVSIHRRYWSVVLFSDGVFLSDWY